MGELWVISRDSVLGTGTDTKPKRLSYDLGARWTGDCGAVILAGALWALVDVGITWRRCRSALAKWGGWCIILIMRIILNKRVEND